MTRHVLGFACFAGFIALGCRVAWTADPTQRRAATNALLAYVVALTVLIGVTNRDAWPFAVYPLVPSRYTLDMNAGALEIVVFDARGREHAVDPFSFSPLFPMSLQLWARGRWSALSADERRRAAAYLLARAEDARQRLARGEWIGSQRLLGPLAAPDWTLNRRPTEVAPDPYTRIRLTRLHWRVADRLADPARVARELLIDYTES